MQSALKTIWTDDLGEQLKQLALPPHRRGPVPLPENVVRPAFVKERSYAAPGQKPELNAALEAVVRASDLIKSAHERALQAEEQNRHLAEQAAERMRDAEAQITQMEERARLAEERLSAVTERAAEKLADADAEIKATREQVRREEERAAAIENRAAQQITELQSLLKDANDRIFASETRTLEAKEDLAYLENYIRERFAL